MSEIAGGLLGYGYAGRVFHAPLIEAERRLSLQLIGSRSFADKSLPEGVSGASVEDVIADPGIDLIVVATPNDSHAALAIAALQAGKHVVVDKPFALNVHEAEAVIAAAETSGRMLSVFQNRRWDGGFLTVQKAMSDGVVGVVNYAEFHFDRFSPAIKDRWREWDMPGAGILYDLGPHLLDQIQCLFGVPDAVTANLARQRPGAVVDDFFHIVLEYGAARVVAHASSLMPDHAPRIAVYGETSTVYQYGFDGQENALKHGHGPGDPEWGKTPGGVAYRLDASGARTDFAFLPGRYEAYYAGVAEAIADGRAPPVTGAQALDVMRVLDAAQLSAQTGRRVAVKSA